MSTDKPEVARDGRMSMPTLTAADDKTAAVTEITVAEAEPEPETGHVLVLDMTSSAIESRRRRRRPRDDGSSDAERETALITQVNVDDIAQLSSDSYQNST